jgi:hypothetical protein
MINGQREILRPHRGKTWKPGQLKVGDAVTAVVAAPPSNVIRILVNGTVMAERQASDVGITEENMTNLWGVVDIEGAAVSVRLSGGRFAAGGPAGDANAGKSTLGSLRVGLGASERSRASDALNVPSHWRQLSPSSPNRTA